MFRYGKHLKSGANRGPWALWCAYLVSLLMLLPSAAFGSLDNKGTEFLMGFLPNYENGGNLQLHLTGDTATTVTVEYPVGTVTGTHSVTPGSVTIVSIPPAAQTWSADAVASNLVRASAPAEFVAYMTNIQPFTSDAALALPVDTMNTEYVLADYNGLFADYPAEFVVFAAYDNTTVTIDPTANIDGHAAGTSFSVVLDAGEGYFNRTTGHTETLTGSIITADKPVGVTNGVECTNIPDGYGACDHTFEVAQPVQSWGTKVGVAGLPLRDTTFYRILASQDGTTVTQDGSIVATLNRGDYHEVGLGGNHVFEADKPIYVVQYMPGQGYPGGNGTGDPAQGNMIPFDQYLTDYTFSTVGGGQFARHFVTIIANNADVGTLTLDGSAVSASSFAPVAASGYSAAVIELTEGTHSTSSNNPHGITVEGYNSYDSYIYPGGALFQFINPVGDSNPPIVTLTTNDGPPPYADGVATDNRPSEDTNGNGILDPGEDLNGDGLIDEDTGIFFVELEAGATNLVLTVDSFVPGDGVVTFTVSLSDPLLPGNGNVFATDGAGNVTSQFVELIPILNQPPVADAGGPYSGNEGTPIGLDGTGSSDADGDPLTYAWSVDSPLCVLDDATSPNPNLTCTDNGDFTVTLTVDDGEATDSDTETVTVANVAPAVSIDFYPTEPVAAGSPAEVGFSFTDPGTNDTHTASCTWDSLPSDEFDPAISPSSCTRSDLDPGLYTVTVEVVDDDGGVGMAETGMIVVYDPAGGFVTGGGWIDSPAGAYYPQALPLYDGSYYELFDASGILWDDANDLVGALTSPVCEYPHLATPTTAEEDQFIVDAFGQAALFGKWLGGFQAPDGEEPAGGWGWVTGEAWDYANWNSGEPNNAGGNEEHLEYWDNGTWNDEGYLPLVTGYLVEYDDCFLPTGKANFGFVSKYKKGATVPTGNTEFQFHAADLNFHSESYEWLVVTGSNYARYKGVGTINGDLAPNGEPYKFMLWAGDGTGTDGADTFRIKIWYEDGGIETVVFDNGMSQDIAGGSIIVHTKK